MSNVLLRQPPSISGNAKRRPMNAVIYHAEAAVGREIFTE